MTFMIAKTGSQYTMYVYMFMITFTLRFVEDFDGVQV